MKVAYKSLLPSFLSHENNIAPIRCTISPSEDGKTLARVLKDRDYELEGHYAVMHPELGLYIDAIDGFRAPKGHFFSFLSQGSWIQVSVDRYIVSAGESIEIALERIHSS